MQLKLHNSADYGISKIFYLRLHLVVGFYPRPPVWPWSWGHTNLYLPYPCVQCFWIINGCSEISSYRPIHAPFFVLLFSFNYSQFNKLEPWVHHLSKVCHLSWGPELIIRFSTRDKDRGQFLKRPWECCWYREMSKVPSKVPCFPWYLKKDHTTKIDKSLWESLDQRDFKRWQERTT